MRQLLLLLFLAQFLLFYETDTAVAQPASKVLVLYKERDPDHGSLVQLYTSLLSTAGYRFDTRDVEQLLVEKPDMTPYLGIMTCYQTTQMVGADVYSLWLAEQMEAGRRVLILGSYGAYQGLIKKPDGSFIEWNESTKTINTFFFPFGLEFYFAFTSDNTKLRLRTAEKEYAQFQEPITQKDLTYYQLFKSVNKDNKIFFEVERTDMLDSRSAFNVITPFGGMLLEPYFNRWDAKLKRQIYRVDIPSFMKEVFSAKSPPLPKLEIITHDQLVAENPLPERKPPAFSSKLGKGEIKRRILVPYKKHESKTLEELHFFNRAAVILEYLGCIPVYWAVEDGLPDDDFMKGFHGIVTWHITPYMTNANEYGKWLLRQVKNGKKLAMLEEYGATYDYVTQEKAASQKPLFEALGIRFAIQGENREEYEPEVRVLDQSLFGFERDLNPKKLSYEYTFTSLSRKNRVFLSFDDLEFGVVDLGVFTPNGGFCFGNAAYYFPPHDKERMEVIHQALAGKIQPEIAEEVTLGSWLIDPYTFFTKALDLEEMPAPDITTLNGSRIFYAHIDGDGLESISLIDKAHFAGFYIYKEILEKYNDIPTTASVISRLVERNGNQYYNPSIELARHIYALPNVDVAVHASTHPFDWVGGDPYIINPNDYPYKVGYRPQNLLDEIWGAKLFVDHNLAPAGKKCETMLWSGATNPDEEALRICWRTGMHNLNGGDPRFDDEYPSIAGVCPYSSPAGPYRQYFTSAQNDYIYTLYLTGDWAGQKKLLGHFEKTDKPYRFYPMNLYYHFYSGIKNESLDALRMIYDYIRSIDAASIFASQYCEIVEDYYNTRIGYDNKKYWVENNGFLRTIRFKDKVHVDMAESEGVVGYMQDRGQTYVHLDGSVRRKIKLANRPPATPFFIQATQYIDASTYAGGQLNFIYRGFGKTLLKFGGLAPGRTYQLSLEAQGRDQVGAELTADANGVAEFRTSLAAPATVYQGNLR